MKLLRIILSFVIIAITATSAFPQTSFGEYKKQKEADFQKYKEQKQRDFEAYRDKVNKEYADYMRKAWPMFNAKPAIPAPPSPKPPKPTVVAPDAKPTAEPLPFGRVKTLPPLLPNPIPLIPSSIPEMPTVSVPTIVPNKPESPATPTMPINTPSKPKVPNKPAMPNLTFDYYGSTCTIPFANSLRITLRNIDEKSVSDAWSQLASTESLDLIESCIDLRDVLRLPDWGYLRLVEKLAAAAYPGSDNEIALLKMFILTQSGYKARIGRNGNRLVVLIPLKEPIYEYPYIPINGMKYYIVDQNISTPSTYIYNQEFPREQIFSLAIRTQPALQIQTTPARSFKSTYGSGLSVDIAVNKNLMAFYNDYPLSNNWEINANASLSDDVKARLYPKLREAIDRKTQAEAANILLRFVQTAFDYMTDDEQFGEERPLFPDETFYYPYSDCEDRAILYAVLVHELLDLEVVLVHYPGHLATAVKFDDDVKGDYFSIDGAKYVVCDPTYINADIGMSMPTCKLSSAEIVKL